MMKLKRAALLLVFLLPYLGFQTATVAFASCSVTPEPTYDHTVLTTEAGNLVAFWPLEETSGTTANDLSGHSYNGTYSGATINAATFLDGNPAPGFDGVNDFVNVYSSSLASAFSGSAGTTIAWLKVPSGGWSDATLRYAPRFLVDSSNFVFVSKTATTNQLNFRYEAGGTSKSLNDTSLAGTSSWFLVEETWDKTADQVKDYINGSQVGSTLTGLGTWAGALSNTTTIIGANTTAGANSWNGNVSHVALWSKALTSSEIAALATVTIPDPTCTPTPTYTPTYTPSYTPTFTLTPSNTPTFTPSPTLTPSDTPTDTLTPSDTPTFTLTPSDTPPPSGMTLTAYYLETNSPTPTYTPTATYTPSDTPTFTLTPSETYTPSDTPTPSPTLTPSDTPTASDTPTPTNTANIVINWTLPPGSGTPEGQNVAFLYSITAGQGAASLVLWLILISLWIGFMFWLLLRPRK